MKHVPPERPSITVGELCQAIAEGQVSATLHKEQWYHVSARDLRRLASQRQSAPIPSGDNPQLLTKRECVAQS